MSYGPNEQFKKPLTVQDLKQLREIAENSTDVVAWRPHHTGDGCDADTATVRGPFGRWLYVKGGTDYPESVADLFDDAKFASAAMNNLVPLLDQIDSMIKVLKKIAKNFEPHQELCCHSWHDYHLTVNHTSACPACGLQGKAHSGTPGNYITQMRPTRGAVMAIRLLKDLEVV